MSNEPSDCKTDIWQMPQKFNTPQCIALQSRCGVLILRLGEIFDFILFMHTGTRHQTDLSVR